MTRAASGRLSELALLRMHGRARDYLDAHPDDHAAIIDACRREATVPELAERMLSRTIYAQAASRVGPLRELIQNALDASPRGARVDVTSGAPAAPERMGRLDDGRGDPELTVVDRGRGMSRAELLEDLLVPFRSSKEGEPDAIGEHGIGFLSALEIAPRIEVTTATGSDAHRLLIEPIGGRAPYPDFRWTLSPLPPGEASTIGTTVRLTLEQPVDRAALAATVGEVAGLVDPSRARIFVNGALINSARGRMRRVARAPIGPGGFLGELELFIGRGDGVPPRFLVTQSGLLIVARHESFGGRAAGAVTPSRGMRSAGAAPFSGPDRSLHRDLVQAITAAGYGLVAALPRAVPLNKGRSGVAAAFARAVEDAITEAFERFILEDALYDRELLRSVDHRLASVLDRLLCASIAGEGLSQPAPAEAVDELAAPSRPRGSPPASQAPAARPPAARPPSVPPRGAHRALAPATEPAPTPTVAAPEDVVRFAFAMLETPMFQTSTFEPSPEPTAGAPRLSEVRDLRPLRALLEAYREDRLRPAGESRVPGVVYLSLSDPLSQSLFRRLALLRAPSAPSARPSASRALSMPCVSREQLLRAAAIPGVRALTAVVSVLERIEASISAAAAIRPSTISVHQDLYGPDEMAHTNGAGISLNLASARIRALLAAALGGDDPVAFGALVDLLLHEKAHVSLASYLPRSTAEHGASFYRRKDWLRRRLLQAIDEGAIPDPMSYVAVARQGITSVALPSPEALADAFSSSEPLAA